MTRLIDADELKESMRKAKRGHYSAFSDVTLRGIFQVIDNAPTVNPSLNLDNITEADIEKFKAIWQRANSKGLLVINNERPRGKWTQESNTDEMLNIWHCSICKEEFCSEIGGSPSEWNYNFCPNCGADMRPQNRIRPKDDDDTWKEDMQRDADAYYESQEGDE